MRVVVILLLAAAILVSCGKHEPEAGKQPDKGGEKADKKAEAESRVSHGTNGEVIITLDADTQKNMGLAVRPLTSARMVPETKGYARVQDMSWLGATISDLQAARIAADAAKNEATRLRTLREQNNASERALQAAEAAAAREETNLKGILIKVQALWGKRLADLVGTHPVPDTDSNKADSLPMQLFDLKQVLVRVDFPPGEPSLAPESDVKLFTLSGNSVAISAHFFDYAPATDPQTQARGVFYTLDNKGHEFAPGMALRAAAPTTEPAREGVIIPREAIVRAEGASWVYVQTTDDKFVRREVVSEQITDEGTFVTKGFSAGTKVVITGAAELLSEEMKEQ